MCDKKLTQEETEHIKRMEKVREYTKMILSSFVKNSEVEVLLGQKENNKEVKKIVVEIDYAMKMRTATITEENEVYKLCFSHLLLISIYDAQVDIKTENPLNQKSLKEFTFTPEDVLSIDLDGGSVSIQNEEILGDSFLKISIP